MAIFSVLIINYDYFNANGEALYTYHSNKLITNIR